MPAIELTGDGIGQPAVDWFNVTPSDTAFLKWRPRAVYVGVSGDLTIQALNGTVSILKSAAVGYHPVRPVRVYSTGTTATNIVALI